MKIYLSNYWRKSSIFIVCLSAIITVATAVFCIQSYDEEDYILIIGALFFVILSFCLQLNALKLLDYVEVSNNQFIMCSVSGKRKCTINSDTLIYYQIVSLIEGTFSRTDFIVLSDQSFPCYQNGNGLAKVCKEINAKGNQIIMPYNKMSKPLLSLRDWHKINCFVLFEQTATIDYYFVCNWRGDVIRIYDGAGKNIEYK